MGDSQLSKKELKARVVDAKKQAKADKKFQKIQAKIDAKEAKKQAKINAVAGRWEQRLASTSSSSPRTTPPQATMPVVSKDSSDNDLNFFTMPAGNVGDSRMNVPRKTAQEAAQYDGNDPADVREMPEATHVSESFQRSTLARVPAAEKDATGRAHAGSSVSFSIDDGDVAPEAVKDSTGRAHDSSVSFAIEGRGVATKEMKDSTGRAHNNSVSFAVEDGGVATKEMKDSSEDRSSSGGGILRQSPAPTLGVRHGDIRQGTGVGGFTRTELAVAPHLLNALTKAWKGGAGAGNVAVVCVKVDSKASSYVLDWTKGIRGALTTAAFVPMMHPTEPRFYYCAGSNVPSRAVFVYCCPSTSPRGDRMIYATAKQHLVEGVLCDVINASLPLRLEVTEPTDLTDDDLAGIVPDATSPPPQESLGGGAPRAQFINPGEREGSLSAVMAKSLGHSTLGRRKVIVSPDAAHGC